MPRPKILVIDDDAEIRYSLSRVLSSRGYQVSEAPSGEQGVAMVKKGPFPDLIYLDIRMTGMSGLEALQHKLVVVKLGYLMPELRDAAPREIMALSPGYADMQLERLPFRYVTRPIFPLERDFTWRAHVSNVAGFDA